MLGLALTLILRAAASGPNKAFAPEPRGQSPQTVARKPVAREPVARNPVDWPNVGNDKGAMRYSNLTQINRETVKNLKVAWVYHTKDAEPEKNSTIECTPIVIGGMMVITTAKLKVVALNAATGKPIWEYDPKSSGVNRGVAYWSDGKPNGKRRIIGAFPDGKLVSLDAKTGKPDPEFGTNGVVDLRKGIERDISKQQYGSTSAPAIFENLAIVPIIVSESQPGAPGDIRAFNVRTGKEVWRFHTAPRPGEFGNETWTNGGWKDRTGINAWAGYTLDAKRGILFAGLGSASSDFYGADRLGDDLFANCTLALNARTGERLWHFQAVHHDLWDHDDPCPPVVCAMLFKGRRVEVVAQPTKTGFVYVFDRLTGKPMFDVKEVPATPSDIPGEVAALTQPEPVLPPLLEPKTFTLEDVTNISPEAAEFVRNKLAKMKFGLPYQPPSLEGTVVGPGYHGGATWSGAAFDPTTNWLYVNTNNRPAVVRLKKNSSDGYDFLGYDWFTDQNGYPGVKPPWGHLTAINLSTGQFAWRITLGEFPELTAKGIPPTGTQNFGGAIVTAGGLVFIGATMDAKFHAFDKATGKLLWDYQLNAGGYAAPSTYSVNGKQYVVIAAGGGGKNGTKSGDEFVAFALP
jgi:quinoprotein glucose dehydrogenase